MIQKLQGTQEKLQLTMLCDNTTGGLDLEHLLRIMSKIVGLSTVQKIDKTPSKLAYFPTEGATST